MFYIKTHSLRTKYSTQNTRKIMRFNLYYNICKVLLKNLSYQFASEYTLNNLLTKASISAVKLKNTTSKVKKVKTAQPFPSKFSAHPKRMVDEFATKDETPVKVPNVNTIDKVRFQKRILHEKEVSFFIYFIHYC